jgi:hypothetical protein
MTLDERRDKMIELLDEAVSETQLATGWALEAISENPERLAYWAAMYDLPVSDDLRRGVLMAARMVLDYPAEDLT